MSAGKQLAQAVSRGMSRLAAGGLVIGGGAFVANECLYNVDAGEAAVLFDRIRGGVQPIARTEGTHFKLPYFHEPIIYSVRAKPRVVNTATPTKDIQTINIALRVLTRPNVEKLSFIHREFGTNYDDRVLPSIVTETLKSVVAQYNADQLITMREQVSRQINEQLVERAAKFHIMLDDVAITHLAFGHDFTTSVEGKVVAQQESERAKFIVDKTEQEKMAKVIKAEGDSLAAEMIAEAVKKAGDGYVEMRRIDAAVEVAKNLAGSRNVMYLPSGKDGVAMLLNPGQ